MSPKSVRRAQTDAWPAGLRQVLITACCAVGCGGAPDVEIPRTRVVAAGLFHPNDLSLDGGRLVIGDRQDISQVALDTLDWSRLVAHVDPEQLLASHGRVYYAAADRVDAQRTDWFELEPETSELTRLASFADSLTEPYKIHQLVGSRDGELLVVALNADATHYELQSVSQLDGSLTRQSLLDLALGQRWVTLEGDWVWNVSLDETTITGYDLRAGDTVAVAVPAPVIDMVAFEQTVVIRTWDPAAAKWELLRLDGLQRWQQLGQGTAGDFPSGIMATRCGIAGVSAFGLDFYSWQGGLSRPMTGKLRRWVSDSNAEYVYVADDDFVYEVRACDD